MGEFDLNFSDFVLVEFFHRTAHMLHFRAQSNLGQLQSSQFYLELIFIFLFFFYYYNLGFENDVLLFFIELRFWLKPCVQIKLVSELLFNSKELDKFCKCPFLAN